MNELRLQGIIARIRTVAHDLNLTGENGIWLVVVVLAHQLPASSAEICDREDSGLAKRAFYGRIPLIGSRQNMFWVDRNHVCDWRRCSKGRWNGFRRAQWERSIGNDFSPRKGERAQNVRYVGISKIVKDSGTRPEDHIQRRAPGNTEPWR